MMVRVNVIVWPNSDMQSAPGGANPAITTFPQVVGYSITRLARASTAGGIAMPMALAVLTLITNSYLVG